MATVRWQAAIEAVLGHRVPDFDSERQFGKWDDCSRRSAAMAADAWGHPVSDLGEAIIGITGVRGVAGAYPQAVVDYLNARGNSVKVEWLTPAEFTARIKAGEVGIVNVWYGDIPSNHREQANGDFGHSFYVGGWNAGRFFELDPLGEQVAYRGTWIEEAELINAAIDSRVGAGKVICILAPAVGVGPGTGDPMITTIKGLTSPQWAQIVTACDLLDGANGKRIAGTKPGYSYPYIGNASGGWWVVQVSSSLPYADGQVRLPALWIKGVNAKLVPAPASTVAPSPVDPSAAVIADASAKVGVVQSALDALKAALGRK